MTLAELEEIMRTEQDEDVLWEAVERYVTNPLD